MTLRVYVYARIYVNKAQPARTVHNKDLSATDLEIRVLTKSTL